jgi:hypothetical protein
MITLPSECASALVRDLGLTRGAIYAKKKADFCYFIRHESTPLWEEVYEIIMHQLSQQDSRESNE